MNQLQKGNYSGGCKAMYRTLLEGVWLSDIGRMAEVRNVSHLACYICNGVAELRDIWTTKEDKV